MSNFTQEQIEAMTIEEFKALTQEERIAIKKQQLGTGE
tara:strand:- start:3022 stop:3135 length:114 start_codon:yes stop_codon:yes gene_type:complete